MTVDIQNQSGFRTVTKRQLSQAIQILCGHLKKQIQVKRTLNLLATRPQLNVVFVNSEKIKKLNHQFRGINKVTDILSFAPSEPDSLGDLVIAIDRVRLDAKQNKVIFSDQLLYILIHGVLHLLGYEHENDDKAARQMYGLQEIIFEKMRKTWP